MNNRDGGPAWPEDRLAYYSGNCPTEDEALERTSHADWYTTAEPRQAMREAVQSVYPHISGDVLDHALACAWEAYLQRTSHEN